MLKLIKTFYYVRIFIIVKESYFIKYIILINIIIIELKRK